MVSKNDLKPVERFVHEIPKDYRPDMRVPARIYADDALLEASMGDRSLEQLINTATLPGVVSYTMAMPDVHQGYGFPIGGVAATNVSSGVISPGGVGYDINCGVRLVTTGISAGELRPHLRTVMDALNASIPKGTGRGSIIPLSPKQIAQVLEKGADWVVKRGHGTEEDLQHTEEHGCMAGGDVGKVSQRAKERGLQQLGSLGSGNHFLEIGEVTETYDEEIAERFGLREGDACVWIHCGSRGLGHQVCGDYVRGLQGSPSRYGFELPDRELVCAPFESPEGQSYFAAMICAANFAWANRQAIMHQVRRVLQDVLAGKVRRFELRLLYDVAHNIAKVEEHWAAGKRVKVCIHRKGATRSFGPGQEEVPQQYRDVGQPVLIPGDMGTSSYVLVGTEKAMRDTFGSACHGAGRVMSRRAAKRKIRGDQLRAHLESRGIVIKASSMAGLAEEAPDAYKDIHRVVQVVHQIGIGRKVARLEPMGVIKG